MTIISNPAPGLELEVSETQVFNGTSPTSWTDLDLSSTIGAKESLVLLKIAGIDTKWFAFRKNGDTGNYGPANHQTPAGCAYVMASIGTGYSYAVWVATDSNGIVEWITETAETYTVSVIAYVN